MSNSKISFLLNPFTVKAFLLAFAVSAIAFVVKYNSLSTMQKTVLASICVICLGYFVFILIFIIRFVSSLPAYEPAYEPALYPHLYRINNPLLGNLCSEFASMFYSGELSSSI